VGRRSVTGMSRKAVYLTMMGTCVALIVLAWNVVRLFSVTAAVLMSVVAALILPTAVILANRDGHGG
jgi:hypothetical protein